MILVDRSQVCVGGDLSPAPLGGSCNVGSAPLHPRKTLPRAKTEISPSLVALMPLLSPSSAPHPSTDPLPNHSESFTEQKIL